MNLLKSVAKNILRKIALVQAHKKVEQLRTVNMPAANKIANAIDGALNDNLSAEEKEWVDRIEELRNVLSSDSTKITLMDYGAGSPELNRTDKEMYNGVVTTKTVSNACSASKPRFWALVLFKLIREFKPTTSIELGTCLGISAAYQAAAHKLNNQGSITTMEGAASLASLSEKNLQKLGLDNGIVVRGRFQDNLDRVLKENKPIDFAFIDGHHDEKATISYFQSFVPNLSKKAVIVFDDISWSDGMRRAWDKIVENENVKITVDLRIIGICVLDNDIETRCGFQIPLPQRITRSGGR
jgi:predicted O-methyltransferase YrrM